MSFKTVLSVILVLILSGFISLQVNSLFKKPNLTSPVLGISKISESVWFPRPQTGDQFTDASEITSEAALFIETNTGQILYQKNPSEKLPIASLVKIMTVIIALERKSYDDIFVVSQRPSEVEPDKMFLIAGEKMTLKELLEGIFLVSANDAAEVIAENTTGRREEFINLMNSKALQLGMNDTLFLNPTGLDDDFSKQYSTALDVAIMSRYLIKKWPEIIDISSNPYVFIEATPYHQDYEMYSGINLLTTYPGVVGLKTGYTPEAGLTLVTLARQGEKQVLGVLLGALNRRDDAKIMLDYSFKKLGF